jgi:isoaspartyl peptidase/L-asparaginase-like protein (Ntn-hydrolase superfamily)
MAANQSAWEVLIAGGSSLDAVVAGATQCENDPHEHSVGYGGLPDASGQVTLDASVMNHLGQCGAVAGMKSIKNAAQVARMVMERTPHVMLVGEGATKFAVEQGMPMEDLLTPEAGEKYREWKALQRGPRGHDTLGILSIDSVGHLAGACSTSGLAFKLPGRVGDSPIIGAGLYVDGGVGAATATGQGEEMIKAVASYAIVNNLRRGMSPREAIAAVLNRHLEQHRAMPEVDISYIALRADGEFSGMTLRRSTNFKYAVYHAGTNRLIDAPALA